MDTQEKLLDSDSARPLLQQWSAWLPLAMPLVALGLVLGHFAVYGITHDTDEGTAAHVFQILMAAQLPIVVYFALVWLPKRPRSALFVLLLQALAGIAAFAGVYFLTG